MNPAVQISDSILQTGFILLPTYAIDSRRSFTLKYVEAVAQKIDGQMVEQCGEPFLLLFPCCFPSPVPFPPQPPQEVAFPCSAASQVLRHSPTSPTRSCPPLGLWPSRTGLARSKAWRRSPGSRAYCFSACAGSSDYAGPDSRSRITRLPCCLPH